jgi:hypothetical protein
MVSDHALRNSSRQSTFAALEASRLRAAPAGIFSGQPRYVRRLPNSHLPIARLSLNGSAAFII